MSPMFRDLRADEIECRVAQAKENGVSLLLYKDARCDQNILDETVGAMNWMRQHTRDNANCIVSIWDDAKKMWVGKEDTGTESNTEKEKGLASDSFKRACFNWGIGRELYTAPFIWISSKFCTALKQNDNRRWQCHDAFEVGKIVIKNKRIVELEIVNAKTGAVCFSLTNGKVANTNAPEPKPEFVCDECGKEIVPYPDANGKIVGVKKHCDGSMAAFNRVLCIDCIQKKAQGGA